jgi:hypothetical protein
MVKQLSEAELRSLLRAEYKTIYRYFKAEAWPLLAQYERSDWGVIFAMQHFSIPTRLLDWTESFACALFFAQLERQPGDEASVWVLDPEALNYLSIGHDGRLSLDEEASQPSVFDIGCLHPKWVLPESPMPTVAAAPIYTNARMVSQRSAFTVMGDSFAPLDEQLDGRLLRDGILTELRLPPETFDDAERYLSMAGLTPFTYYPDLYGLGLKHRVSAERKIRDMARFYPGAVIAPEP